MFTSFSIDNVVKVLHAEANIDDLAALYADDIKAFAITVYDCAPGQRAITTTILTLLTLPETEKDAPYVVRFAARIRKAYQRHMESISPAPDDETPSVSKRTSASKRMSLKDAVSFVKSADKDTAFDLAIDAIGRIDDVKLLDKLTTAIAHRKHSIVSSENRPALVKRQAAMLKAVGHKVGTRAVKGAYPAGK